jgi:hypothetical protein
MLSVNKVIGVLNVSGDVGAELGAGIGPLLQAIGRNEWIVELNISGHNLGNSVFDRLFGLLNENKTIQKVAFDDNKIESIEAFRSLIKKLKGLPRAVSLVLPSRDISRIKEGTAVNVVQPEVTAIVSELRELEPKQTPDVSKRPPLPTQHKQAPGSLTGKTLLPAGRKHSLRRAVTGGRMSLQAALTSVKVVAKENVLVDEVDGELVIEPTTQAESVLEPSLQMALDCVNEDYILDTQWESLLDDIPEENLDGMLQDIERNFKAANVLRRYPRTSR